MRFRRPTPPPTTRPPGDMKVANLTGPKITSRFGVGAADLGAMVEAANGEIIAVFGDTFRDARVGSADWRSPVILIGHRDDAGRVLFDRAGGPDPGYARQLWPYVHDTSPWRGGGFSTVIPSDLLRVGDDLFLHAMVIRGFPHVAWSEIWRSSDNGVTWGHMGPAASFATDLHNGLAQSWTWDFDPDDGWVYVISTAFQSGSPMILRRVRPEAVGDRDAYVGWGVQDRRWGWGNPPTPITPPGEQWRETTFRRLAEGNKVGWVLGGFCISDRGLSYRVLNSPTDDLTARVKTTPITELHDWSAEDHPAGKVGQAYGGYVIPGSRLDVPGGVHLAVSQWNTATNWPYRVMQFATTLSSPPPTGPAQAVLAHRTAQWIDALNDMPDIHDESDIGLQLADAARALRNVERTLRQRPSSARP
ncbi:DUF4185 domain-containing protein [Gordonia sp. ABSL1-1]|uniref:DUF4185 domain-containing protein n=1 Tax=Gordonia sp. ABSL1-1 TaxID=3053923 RepID=UPI0025746EA8|nr:DUF4185 domain-containing protein [Gordonia sp. ABSL1-1]MDL9937227.1 DUF4185 domain-containing protein [Gordonia sp. ABSL1-1]